MKNDNPQVIHAVMYGIGVRRFSHPFFRKPISKSLEDLLPHLSLIPVDAFRNGGWI